MDRTVKDLQTQIERKDKQNMQLSDDVNRMRDRVDKLLKTIDELQASESSNQLSARRAERELREEKEKCHRLERELEGWKGLRTEKGGVGSVRGRGVTWRVGNEGEDSTLIDVPQRNSSLNRAPSMTKGFL